MGGGGPSGHTLETEATPQELFLYATRALRIGLSLGDKVVLVGMSTGACLATWLAAKATNEEKDDSMAGLVLISPAFALAHPLYPVLKNIFSTLRVILPPIRRILIEVVAGGKERRLKAMNEQHARFQSLQYPTKALLNLFDVLWEVETYLQQDRSLFLNIPTIMIGNPQDPVVNFRTVAINLFLQKWGDVPKRLHCVSNSEHPHVLGSQILSPSTVDEVSQSIALFLQTSTRSNEAPTIMKRTQSLSGLGQYASYSSLSDLRRPLIPFE